MSTARTLSEVTSRAIASGGARLLGNRRFMRAPIWLYRARLGFLFGSRMLLLEHIGRKSGAKRYVVLEVFDHPTPDSYVVVSGFGARAQWFRNVRAEPRVRVAVAGHGPADATARMLEPDEAAVSLRAYVARHPRAWARFKPILDATLGSPVGEGGAELPMVRLDLDL